MTGNQAGRNEKECRTVVRVSFLFCVFIVSKCITFLVAFQGRFPFAILFFLPFPNIHCLLFCFLESCFLSVCVILFPCSCLSTSSSFPFYSFQVHPFICPMCFFLSPSLHMLFFAPFGEPFLIFSITSFTPFSWYSTCLFQRLALCHLFGFSISVFSSPFCIHFPFHYLNTCTVLNLISSVSLLNLFSFPLPFLVCL